ncbi:MAG: anthranilate synthase component I family protein [Proteobacteria bacterium]|nr:anthranilate synthase component I family protein [Pseudomonadota bacterium]
MGKIKSLLKPMRLKCATFQLPYRLGEMPHIFRSLSPFDPVVFLESREGTEKYARYGITAARPLLVVNGKGPHFSVRDRQGNREEIRVEDPLEVLKSLEPEAELPEVLDDFRFAAGWVGSLGYESCGLFENISRAPQDDLDLPDSVFYLPSVLVLKDAVRKHLLLVCLDEKEDAARRLCAQVASHLVRVSPREPAAPDKVRRSAGCSFPEEDFLGSVRQAKRLITEGEMIQVVLSRRWEVTPAPEPEAVYDALSLLNPSPYHFFVRMGEDAVLLGASPELLVRREDEALTVRPIAGTRPRGKDPEQDQAMEREMLADPKENAEHIMLVDLGRNDLGRVSEPGSVKVTRRMTVEKYSHVMHLVSEVRSSLAAGSDSYDVLRSCFPAGTVSGAPKIRAMRAIAAMEPVVRGPYAGGVGYFDVRGNMDFCITIRSVFFSGGRAFVQSGAGIVADSVPERERDEIDAKAAAMFRAFGDVELSEGKKGDGPFFAGIPLVQGAGAAAK